MSWKNLKSFISNHHVKFPIQVYIDYGKPYIKILGSCDGIKAGTLIVATHSYTVIGQPLMGINSDYLLHYTHCCMYTHKYYNLNQEKHDS